MAKPIDAATIKRVRSQLVNDTDLAGRSLARRLSQQADSWFESLAGSLPSGWAVMATGGYAGGVLCPGSDIDVVLLHPNKAADAQVRDVAEGLWYPLWDGGIKLSPAAHTIKSLLSLASDDLETATTILRVRCLAGDHELVHKLQSEANDQWRRKPLVWLQRLHESAQLRWEKLGDVASLLEPDLKDARGGLRDHDMIRWALAVERADVAAALEGPFEDLAGPAEMLLATRCELHRATGRFVNTLLLQDQDRVAEAMGYVDADALMANVSSAAHAIEWATERFWRRIERLTKRSGPPIKQLPDQVSGVTVVDGEAQITADADVDEQSFVFRMAAAAAHAGVPIGARSLRMMASRGPNPGEEWTERTRRAFLSLLGAGQSMVNAVEALERYDLFSRYLPEWRAVRSLPQRNAFHTFTVDRHLLQTVANAGELMRTVSRPDLLLVGALLHDIGKGYPGDHTEAGMELVGVITARMGFDEHETATIRSLIEHHLLISETATRRDLSDPRTAANVAAAVGDADTLDLLVALTEADSKATGPAAWSSWKATLIDELVQHTRLALRGERRSVEATPLDSRFSHLVEQVQAGGGVLIEHESVGDFDMLRIASADRRGLFALIAGTLAFHGLDVVGAEAFTGADGTAVDEFRILRSSNGVPPNWSKFAQDLRGVLKGDVDIDARLEQRIKSMGRTRRALSAAPPRFEVLIDNDASDSTTMIDVRVPDAPATLYRLSHALADAGYDIRSAKVVTLGHEVVDVFYVQCPEGKLPSGDHDVVRERLKSALV